MISRNSVVSYTINYTHVQSNFIYHIQKVKTTQMSIHTMEYYSRIKTTDTSNSMDEFKKHHANWKKPDLNGLWFHLNRVRENCKTMLKWLSRHGGEVRGWWAKEYKGNFGEIELFYGGYTTEHIY